MSRINRPPLGLQGLLGSQNLGVNPDELGQQVLPTLDIFPFYGAQLTTHFSIPGGRTTEGTIVSKVIPAGEMWGLIGVGAVCAGITGAGGDIQLSIQLAQLPGNAPGQFHPLVTGPLQTVNATNVPTLSLVLPFPLLLEPNTEIFLVADVNTLAAADSFRLSILYYKLDV